MATDSIDRIIAIADDIRRQREAKPNPLLQPTVLPAPEQKPFDPEGNGYDYQAAAAAGLGPDATGHWPSRNPQTGQVLKGKSHETFAKTAEGENAAGYEMTKGQDGKYYSVPKVAPDPIDNIINIADQIRKKRLARETEENLWTKGELRRGFASGVDQVQGLLKGSIGLAADLLPDVLPGTKAVKRWGYEGYKRNMEEAATNPLSVPNFTDVKWKDPSSFVDWFAGNIGQLTPSVIEGLVSAVAGATIMGAMTGGPGAAPGALAGFASKTGMEKLIQMGVKKEIAKQVENGIARSIATQVAPKIVARRIGANVGTVLGTAALEGGANWGTDMEKLSAGRIKATSPFANTAYALVSGFSEIFTPQGALARKLSMATDIKPIRKMSQAAYDKNIAGMKNVLKRAGVTVPVAMGKEGLQEGFQEFMSVLSEMASDPTVNPLDQERLKRYLNSAAAGAAGGVLFGGGEAFAKPPTEIIPELPPAEERLGLPPPQQMLPPPQQMLPPPEGPSGPAPAGPLNRAVEAGALSGAIVPGQQPLFTPPGGKDATAKTAETQTAQAPRGQEEDLGVVFPLAQPGPEDEAVTYRPFAGFPQQTLVPPAGQEDPGVVFPLAQPGPEDEAVTTYPFEGFPAQHLVPPETAGEQPVSPSEVPTDSRFKNDAERQAWLDQEADKLLAQPPKDPQDAVNHFFTKVRRTLNLNDEMMAELFLNKTFTSHLGDIKEAFKRGEDIHAMADKFAAKIKVIKPPPGDATQASLPAPAPRPPEKGQDTLPPVKGDVPAVISPDIPTEKTGQTAPPADQAVSDFAKDFVTRQNNAAQRFVASAVEQFGITEDEAKGALNHYVKRKIVKLSGVNGSYTLQNGVYWDKETMLAAARVNARAVKIDAVDAEAIDVVRKAHGEAQAKPENKGQDWVPITVTLDGESGDLLTRQRVHSKTGKPGVLDAQHLEYGPVNGDKTPNWYIETGRITPANRMIDPKGGKVITYDQAKEFAARFGKTPEAMVESPPVANSKATGKGATPAEAAKQPEVEVWQKTWDQHLADSQAAGVKTKKREDWDTLIKNYRKTVRDAYAAGKPVPQNVIDGDPILTRRIKVARKAAQDLNDTLQTGGVPITVTPPVKPETDKQEGERLDKLDDMAPDLVSTPALKAFAGYGLNFENFARNIKGRDGRIKRQSAERRLTPEQAIEKTRIFLKRFVREVPEFARAPVFTVTYGVPKVGTSLRFNDSYTFDLNPRMLGLDPYELKAGQKVKVDLKAWLGDKFEAKATPKAKVAPKEDSQAQEQPKSTPKSRAAAAKQQAKEEALFEYGKILQQAYQDGLFDEADFIKIVGWWQNGELKPLKRLVDKLAKGKSGPNFAEETYEAFKGEAKTNMRRLMKIVGAQMYGNVIGSTTIKEMVQNSFDTVKISLREGEIEEGHVDVLLVPKQRMIIVRDNGRGMDKKTILGAFLTVAESDKEGLEDPSGNFGMAKAVFIYGNERLKGNTVKGGIRITFDTTPDELFDGTPDFQPHDARNSPTGTVIVVTLPKTVRTARGEQEVWFPTQSNIEFFKKPLLHDKMVIRVGTIDRKIDDVELDAISNSNDSFWTTDNPELETLPLGKNQDLTGYDLYTVFHYSWGKANFYLGRNRKVTDWDARHYILSAGVYQFNEAFPLDRSNRVPYDIILNVFPNVEGDDPAYPFDVKREGWKEVIKGDIDVTKQFIRMVALGEEAQSTVDSFSDVMSMPEILEKDIGKPGKDIRKQVKITKKSTDKPKTVYRPRKLDIQDGQATGKDREGTKRVFAASDTNINSDSSFTAEHAAPSAKDFMRDVGLDDRYPAFHNNTSVDYEELAQQHGLSAWTFFAEIGAVMVKMRKVMAESYGYSELKDPDISTYVGVSIDKGYNGVNIGVPFRGVFLNPISLKDETVPGMAQGFFNTIVHEYAHVTTKTEDKPLVQEIDRIMVRLSRDGTDVIIRGLLSRIIKKHRDLIRILSEEYERSTTRNVRTPFDQIQGGVAFTAARRENGPDAIPAGAGRDALDSRQAGKEPGRGQGLRGTTEDRGRDGSRGKFSKSKGLTTSTPQTVLAELYQSLGKIAVNHMMRQGYLKILATQEQLRKIVNDPGITSGLTYNNVTYLVADGIDAGDAAKILDHEVGLHLRNLMMNSADFATLKGSILRRQNEQSKTGEAIRSALARMPKNTMESGDTDLIAEEVLGYIVEDAPQVSIVRQFFAMVKKFLSRIFGANYAEKMTVTDIKAMAMAAVRSQKKQVEQSTPIATKPKFSKKRTMEEEAFDDITAPSSGFFRELFKMMNPFVKDRILFKNPDTTILARFLSTPLHYFRDIPAMHRVFEESLRGRDIFQLAYDRIKNFGGEITSPEYLAARKYLLAGKANYLENIAHLRDTNPQEFGKLSRYIILRDINKRGYTVTKNDDGTFTYHNERGKPLGQARTERLAWNLAFNHEAEQFAARGMGREAMAALIGFRQMTLGGFDLLYADMQKFILAAEKAGKKLPTIPYINEQGEKVQIDLKTALSMMGDARGYFYPRNREKTSYAILATHPTRPSRRIPVSSAHIGQAHVNKLNKEGWTAKLVTSGGMADVVYDLAQDMIKTQTKVNDALSHIELNTDATYADYNLTPTWETTADDQQEFVIYGAVPKGVSQILKRQFGGKWYKGGPDGKKAWRFTGAKPAIEKRILRMIAGHSTMTKVDEEMLSVLAKALGEQFSDIFRERGFRSHMMRRKVDAKGDVWLGYETDMQKAVESYTVGIAAGEAKKQKALNMARAFLGTDISYQEFQDGWYEDEGEVAEYRDSLPADEVDPEGTDYLDYLKFVNRRKVNPRTQPKAYEDGVAYQSAMLRNEDDFDKALGVFKGAAVLFFLGFRYLAAPVINITAMISNFPAVLMSVDRATTKKTPAGTIQVSKRIGLHEIPGLLKTAYQKGLMYYRLNKDGNRRGLTSEDVQVFAYIESHGWGNDQFNREAVSALQSRVGRHWSRFIEISMLAFKWSEMSNRYASIYAAYQVVKGTGKTFAEDMAKARDVSDLSHGVYGKENRPYLAQQVKLLQPLYVFQTFLHNYWATLYDLGVKRKERKAAMWMMLAPSILAGATAQPLVALLIQAAGKIMGEDDPDEAFYAWMAKTFGASGERVARLGLTGLAGIDFSGSLDASFRYPKKPVEYLGAPGAVVSNLVRGAQDIMAGNVWKGTEKMLPLAASSVSKGIRQYKEGVSTPSNVPIFSGNEPLKLTFVEAMTQALGFTPARPSTIRDIHWSETQTIRKYRERKSEIYDLIRRAYLTGTSREQWAELMAMRAAFNADAAKASVYVPPITKQSLRALRKTMVTPPKQERVRVAKAGRTTLSSRDYFERRSE